MVATHLLPLYLGENVFPWVFLLSSPVLSLCSRSSRFATLGRGGSGEFRDTINIIIMHSCNPNDRFDL